MIRPIPILVLLCCLSVPALAEKPNVVMIISDDQAWNDYSFMGHPHIETPNLDRLAAESLTFRRGYVPDSLCRPSLVTIVTGLYPHQHGIVGNDPPPPEDLADKSKRAQRADPRYLQRRIDYIRHIDKVPTLAGMLGDIGYLSHQSGKWWEGHFSRGGFTHGMTHGDRRKGGRHGDLGLTIGRKGLKPIADFMDHAASESKPFFVYYAPFLPHTPHNPPQRLLKKYQAKTESLPVAKYWAMCEWFDETVGELLNLLKDRGLEKDTIVLYVTDNGWINLTERSAYAPRSKRSPNEGGIRTPIMVRWPGRVKPRMDDTSLASSIDLVPTVLTAVGLKPTERMDGINLLDANAVSQRETIFGEIFEHDIQHMTRPEPSLRYRWCIDKQWKLIKPGPRLADESPQLYDLSSDPHELSDLADKHPDLVRKLSSRIEKWRNLTAR